MFLSLTAVIVAVAYCLNLLSEKRIMALKDDVLAAVTQATNDISAKIEAEKAEVIEAINASGVSEEDRAAIIAAVQGIGTTIGAQVEGIYVKPTPPPVG